MRNRSISFGALLSSVRVQGLFFLHGSLRISVLTDTEYRAGPSQRRVSATALASGPKPSMTVLSANRTSGVVPSVAVIEHLKASTRRVCPPIMALRAARIPDSQPPMTFSPSTSRMYVLPVPAGRKPTATVGLSVLVRKPLSKLEHVPSPPIAKIASTSLRSRLCPISASWPACVVLCTVTLIPASSSVGSTISSASFCALRRPPTGLYIRTTLLMLIGAAAGLVNGTKSGGLPVPSSMRIFVVVVLVISVEGIAVATCRDRPTVC
mmetsp:Transcript_42038/g.84396  ORF Transcript_42038/g.84396 Transcript_42038/m.84396 type:complete len:266 (-) Transcript_42038:47-844(-)